MNKNVNNFEKEREERIKNHLLYRMAMLFD